MSKPRQIDPDEPLRDAEERPIGVSIPVPLSRRLDALVERAASAGPRVYRKDLVAALLLAAPEDPDDLADLVLRFGRAKARDASLSGDQDGTVLELARPKPGRRPRRPS